MSAPAAHAAAFVALAAVVAGAGAAAAFVFWPRRGTPSEAPRRGLFFGLIAAALLAKVALGTAWPVVAAGDGVSPGALVLPHVLVLGAVLVGFGVFAVTTRRDLGGQAVGALSLLAAAFADGLAFRLFSGANVLVVVVPALALAAAAAAVFAARRAPRR